MDYTDLIWSSDWNGDEVGYNNVNVVGLYRLKIIPEIWLYLDVEELKILEVWIDDDDE